MPRNRTGLLIIRAWLEAGSTEPLRAQIRVTDDISTGIERTLNVVQPESVNDVVDSWIRGMLVIRPSDHGF
jgi:hypothetical protein